jgi:hypothetical protein
VRPAHAAFLVSWLKSLLDPGQNLVFSPGSVRQGQAKGEDSGKFFIAAFNTSLQSCADPLLL